METPVIVALIATFASLTGLVISKELKVSEFRQDWINKLREDISGLIGALIEFSDAWSKFVGKYHVTSATLEKFWQENGSAVKQIDSLVIKSKLRLNPTKDAAMIALLTGIKVKVTAADKLASGELEQYIAGLDAAIHDLLKTEWDRVKKGEPIFKIMKCCLGIALVFWVSYVIFTIFTNGLPSLKETTSTPRTTTTSKVKQVPVANRGRIKQANGVRATHLTASPKTVRCVMSSPDIVDTPLLSCQCVDQTMFIPEACVEHKIEGGVKATLLTN